MSNDIKTLADAQPGGRVRLGDAPHYWPEVDRILVDAYAAGSEGDEFDMIAARNAISAALSAQPSPGGQDALQLANEWRHVFNGNGHDMAGANKNTIRRFIKAIEALAARQPVEAVPQGCDACDQTGIRRNDEGRNICCPDCDLGRSCAGDTRQPVGEPVDDDAASEAFAEFADDYLTDGNGYAPASTYEACGNAFKAAWPDRDAAVRAARAELKRLHGDDRTVGARRAEALNRAGSRDDAEDDAAPPAQAVDLPYSLDADPAGIRARVCDVITGTLMIGAQGHTPPPAGHWAEPFWQAARADATAQAVDLVSARDSIQSLLNWIDDWAETPEESGLDPIAERALEVVAQIDAQVYAREPNTAPNRLTDAAQANLFYIQDTRQFVGNCPMWWGPNGSGYVTRLDEAGRYTEQEAIKQNRTRETDVPWPCSEIDALARQTVDCQHMRPRAERLAELALIDSQAVRK